MIDLDLTHIIRRHRLQAGRHKMMLSPCLLTALTQQRDIGALLLEVRRLRAENERLRDEADELDQDLLRCLADTDR